MYGKVILCLALFAFVSVQLADSLKCYECNGSLACRSPVTVQCDQQHANDTRDLLVNYYQQVNHYNTTNYSCYIGTYNDKNVTVVDVRGCIITDTVSCSTPLKNTTWTKDTCKTCKSDLCNVRNSVGTYSFSIVTTISLLVLAKVIGM